MEQSSTGKLSLVLSSHSLGEWRHLVCYQEGTISPRLGLGMCDTLTLDQWACGLLQGLATLGEDTLVPDLGVTQSVR